MCDMPSAKRSRTCRSLTGTCSAQAGLHGLESTLEMGSRDAANQALRNATPPCMFTYDRIRTRPGSRTDDELCRRCCQGLSGCASRCAIEEMPSTARAVDRAAPRLGDRSLSTRSSIPPRKRLRNSNNTIAAVVRSSDRSHRLERSSARKPAYSRRLPLFVHALILCVALSTVRPTDAQDVVPGPGINSTNVEQADPWGWARVRGIAIDAPVTNALRTVKGASAVYRDLFTYFEAVVQSPNCALRDNQWIQDMNGYTGVRGWEMPTLACVSDTRNRAEELPMTAKEHFDILTDQSVALSGVSEDIRKNTASNFSKSDTVVVRSFPYTEGYRSCIIEKIVGLRYKAPGSDGNGQWYFLSGITNENMTKSLPDWERQYINEFVAVDEDGKFVGPLGQNIRPPSATSIDDERETFSTALELWDGVPGLSAIFNMIPSENPALQRALDKTERQVSQAVDALTPSNIAILALPMVMNLVPIALIADVSTCGMLVYTVFSDMLTTVPFIIKGFELLNDGFTVQYEADTWFTGDESSEWIVAETWGCKCDMASLKSTGAAFVGVGFACLVIGVAAEWWARGLRRRWLKNGTIGQRPTDDFFVSITQKDMHDMSGHGRLYRPPLAFLRGRRGAQQRVLTREEELRAEEEAFKENMRLAPGAQITPNVNAGMAPAATARHSTPEGRPSHAHLH